MQWYYLLQGQRQGPIDDAGLQTLVLQGIVRDETLVWREGLTEWHPYGAVKPSGIKPVAAQPEPPAKLDTPSKPDTSSKLDTPVKPIAKPEPASKPEPIPRLEPKPQPAPFAAAPHREPGWPEALPFPDSPAPHGGPSPGYAAPAKSHSSGGHRAFFFYPVLDALADGGVIRKGVVVCLKIAAVIVALAGILGALTVLINSLHGTAGTALGGILFALIVLGTTACVAQICWHRAQAVAALPYNAAYTAIPIFSILSRGAGEAAATGLVGIGAGSCLFFWFSPEGAAGAFGGVPFLASMPAEGGFLTGLIVLVYLAALGFGALILGYLWAECVMLLVDIERNTRKSV